MSEVIDTDPSVLIKEPLMTIMTQTVAIRSYQRVLTLTGRNKKSTHRHRLDTK